MTKITEVLRLDAQGLSQGEFALSTAMSKTAVREYLFRARQAGVVWPLPEALTAEALEAALFPAPVVAGAGVERPFPDWRLVHKELKRKDCHVTLRLLWLEWKEANPDVGARPAGRMAAQDGPGPCMAPTTASASSTSMSRTWRAWEPALPRLA